MNTVWMDAFDTENGTKIKWRMVKTYKVSFEVEGVESICGDCPHLMYCVGEQRCVKGTAYVVEGP